MEDNVIVCCVADDDAELERESGVDTDVVGEDSVTVVVLLVDDVTERIVPLLVFESLPVPLWETE